MSEARRGGSWRAARAAVLRESTVCWICGKPGATTVDHIIPRSLGGPEIARENLRPAHAACNTARGNGRRGGQAQSRVW